MALRFNIPVATHQGAARDGVDDWDVGRHGALAGTCGRTWGRLLNAALGLGLIISGLLVPRRGVATFWTDYVVGFGLVFFAILPSCMTPFRDCRADG